MLGHQRAALGRFMAAYLETVDWMYSDAAALKHYADYSGLPANIVQRVREFIPKASMAPQQIVGMDQIVADPLRTKFIAEPLTPAQIQEHVQIPTPQ